MKHTSLALGILVAVFTLWWMLDDEVLRETSAPQPEATAGLAEVVEAPAKPVPPVQVLEDGRNERTGVVESDESTDSCAELYRRAETSNMRIGLAEGREDEANCARMLTMIFGERVPAIPGFAGFDVRDMGELSPRARLTTEADNPEWSRAMEGAILDEITSLLDFPVTTLHTVCKSSTCGLLFAYRTADHHGGNYNFFAQQLADELGFSGFHGGHSRDMGGNGFTYIYLGDWATRRPDDGLELNVPTSFDEAAALREGDASTQ